MEGSTIVLLELILVLGGVLGFAFCELYKLRRDKRAAEQEDDPGAG